MSGTPGKTLLLTSSQQKPVYLVSHLLINSIRLTYKHTYQHRVCNLSILLINYYFWIIASSPGPPEMEWSNKFGELCLKGHCSDVAKRSSPESSTHFGPVISVLLTHSNLLSCHSAEELFAQIIRVYLQSGWSGLCLWVMNCDWSLCANLSGTCYIRVMRTLTAKLSIASTDVGRFRVPIWHSWYVAN